MVNTNPCGGKEQYKTGISTAPYSFTFDIFVWSSFGSPHTRTIPHSAPDREVEQNVNIPNQLYVQSGTVPIHETIRTNSPEEVIIHPSSNQ